MKTYFLAIKQDAFPFIIWEQVAKFETTEDFEASEWGSNPLVKERGDFAQIYGTYSFHIVDDKFVDRTEEEMAAFAANFNDNVIISLNRNRINTLRESTFSYDEKEFPMDENSRLYYSTFNEISTSKKIMTSNGSFYALEVENITDFLKTYYQKLNDITQHDD